MHSLSGKDLEAAKYRRGQTPRYHKSLFRTAQKEGRLSRVGKGAAKNNPEGERPCTDTTTKWRGAYRVQSLASPEHDCAVWSVDCAESAARGRAGVITLPATRTSPQPWKEYPSTYKKCKSVRARERERKGYASGDDKDDLMCV